MPIKHFIDTLMSCTRICFLLPTIARESERTSSYERACCVVEQREGGREMYFAPQGPNPLVVRG